MKPLNIRKLLLFSTACIGLAVTSWATAFGQDSSSEESRRGSVKIEPYTGPPIFLPEDEPPPPPKEVESRVVKETFPGTETVRFERGVLRMSDDSILNDGDHKEFYSNGNIYVTGEFDHGVATGEWTYHHPNGELAKKVTYVQGRPNGKIEVFGEEGKLVARREYKNGLRVGQWDTYSADGEQKIREDHYRDGKANGVFKVWYSSGQLRREVTFAKGKQDGVAREWSQSGEKRAEINYKDGLKHGKATVWRLDGKVIKQTYNMGKLSTEG